MALRFVANIQGQKVEANNLSSIASRLGAFTGNCSIRDNRKGLEIYYGSTEQVFEDICEDVQKGVIK